MELRHLTYVGIVVALLQLGAVDARAQDAMAETFDRFGHGFARGDFNGDDIDDLAIGVSLESISTSPFPRGPQITYAGAVEVIYGSTTGLTSANRQFWRQGAAGVNDAAEESDRFGAALASGDFNNDSYDDLAIGVPGESIGTIGLAGAVNIIYGSPSGLSTSAVPGQFWHQNVPDVLGSARYGDGFGTSVAVGYFNDDEFADLAVGAPGDSGNFGGVHIFYGTTTGIAAVSNQYFSQGNDTNALLDVAEAGDSVGWSLATADFNADFRDDLAIGAPGENEDAGAVHVLYSGPAGLRLLNQQFWQQGSLGVNDLHEAGDSFGWSLATGNFDGWACPDLAIGVPHENPVFQNPQSSYRAGAVNVLFCGGGPAGLTAGDDDQIVYQGHFIGVQDVPEAYDMFGYALGAGNFNGDLIDDLAIGVPGENNRGAVSVIYGYWNALGTFYDDQLLHQDSPGVEDVAEFGDTFGWSLGAGDFNDDGADDLAIGAPTEGLYSANGPISYAGAANVIYSSNVYYIGLSAEWPSRPDQFFTQQMILPPLP